jgi:hypothetical protein
MEIKEEYFYSELYDGWASALEGAGQYKEAYFIFKKHYDCYRKVHDEKHSRTLAMMEAQQKVLTLRFQAQQLSEQKQALETQRNIQEVELRRYVDYKIYVEELLGSFSEIVAPMQKNIKKKPVSMEAVVFL